MHCRRSSRQYRYLRQILFAAAPTNVTRVTSSNLPYDILVFPRSRRYSVLFRMRSRSLWYTILMRDVLMEGFVRNDSQQLRCQGRWLNRARKDDVLAIRCVSSTESILHWKLLHFLSLQRLAPFGSRGVPSRLMYSDVVTLRHLYVQGSQCSVCVVTGCLCV